MKSTCGLATRLLRELALISEFLDIYLVDGLGRGVAWVPRSGRPLRPAPFQNGLIQFYAAATALGVAGLLLILLLMM